MINLQRDSASQPRPSRATHLAPVKRCCYWAVYSLFLKPWSNGGEIKHIAKVKWARCGETRKRAEGDKHVYVLTVYLDRLAWDGNLDSARRPPLTRFSVRGPCLCLAGEIGPVRLTVLAYK